MRSHLILILLPLAIAACSGDNNEPTNETAAVGFVRVTAATAGLNLDSDGYTVTLDPGGADAQSQPLPANGRADFGGVAVGDHTFVVEGVDSNCVLGGDSTQPLTVVGAQIQPLPVAVTCTGTPLAGPNQITFESDRDGFSEIYTMHPDGTHQVRVTNDELTNIRPSYAPDGSSIAFAQSTDAGDDDVFTVAPDGSGETDLSQSSDLESDPSWSPDATRIAFLIDVGFGGGVAVMNADGSEFRYLFHGNAAGKPAWSPDGIQIAFESDSTIMVMGANGTSPTPVGPADSHNPAWSPDGTRIAFDNPSQPGGAGIFTMGTDGSAVTQVTVGDDHAPTWSPDGAQIAFSRGAEDTEAQDIFVVNLDGSGLTQLTTDTAADAHPSWSR